MLWTRVAGAGPSSDRDEPLQGLAQSRGGDSLRGASWLRGDVRAVAELPSRFPPTLSANSQLWTQRSLEFLVPLLASDSPLWTHPWGALCFLTVDQTLSPDF